MDKDTPLHLKALLAQIAPIVPQAQQAPIAQQSETYFLRITKNPRADISRNWSCNIHAWVNSKEEADEQLFHYDDWDANDKAHYREKPQPLQDPVSGKWCFAPERGLSGFEFHNEASLRTAVQNLSGYGYANYAVFKAREWYPKAGHDGEDVFVNGSFLGYIQAQTPFGQIDSSLTQDAPEPAENSSLDGSYKLRNT